MSHKTLVDARINREHLDCLEEAANKFGADLMRDQRTFKMYGSPKPCFHAIRLRDNPNAYEIGLEQVEAHDPDTFRFACDFFDGQLTRAFGPNLENLTNEYLAAVGMKKFAEQGAHVEREQVGQRIELLAYVS